MQTPIRSRIGCQREDGLIDSIICLNEGHLERCGELLMQHFDSTQQAQALVGLGNIASVKPELYPDKDIEEYNGWKDEGLITAYMRESGDVEEMTITTTFHELVDVCKEQDAEHMYLFSPKENKWYYSPIKQHVKLECLDQSIQELNSPLER